MTSNGPETTCSRSYTSASIKVASSPDGAGERPGGRDRAGGEVHASHCGSPPGPGEGVRAEMAHQMQKRLPGDVSDLFHLDLSQPIAALADVPNEPGRS
jgi:hypothetical protein